MGAEAGYIYVQGCKHQTLLEIRAAQTHSNCLLPTVVRYRVRCRRCRAVVGPPLFPRLDILFKTLDVALEPLDGGLESLESLRKL